MNKIISQTLYRKYRPKNFNEVIGQEEVVTILKNSIENNNIAHAYLFSGGRGSGKTTISRILAKEINTAQEDIYEIDAASNRKIEEIRELRDTINILPLASKYKVYIIDEVHMLTKEAFNALLKTLEEPPKHVIFILATTEKNKVLDTIKSRCQVLDFKKGKINELIFLIDKISKSENIKIDKESKNFIALLGDGSFRDTISFLQKSISFCGQNIKIEEIKRIFQDNDINLENQLLEALNNKDKKETFIIYNKIIENRLDFEILFQNILEKIRSILLIRNSIEFENLYKEKFSEEQVSFLKKLTNINSLFLKKILEFFELAKKTNNKEVAFEIFLFSFFE